MAKWECRKCDNVWDETGHPNMKCPKCGSDDFYCVEDCTDYRPVEVKITIGLNRDTGVELFNNDNEELKCCGIRVNPWNAFMYTEEVVELKAGTDLVDLINIIDRILTVWLCIDIKQNYLFDEEIYSRFLDDNTLDYDEETTKLSKLVEKHRDLLLKHKDLFIPEFISIIRPYLDDDKKGDDNAKGMD